MASTLHICAAKVKVYGRTAYGYIPQGEDMAFKRSCWGPTRCKPFLLYNKGNCIVQWQFSFTESTVEMRQVPGRLDYSYSSVKLV